MGMEGWLCSQLVQYKAQEEGALEEYEDKVTEMQEVIIHSRHSKDKDRDKEDKGKEDKGKEDSHSNKEAKVNKEFLLSKASSKHSKKRVW